MSNINISESIIQVAKENIKKIKNNIIYQDSEIIICNKL